MSKENPLWGAPRIHGELLKLGFEIAESTVSKYMIRRRGPPSQTWRTFLANHADAIAAIDLYVVPTLAFERLFAFLIMGHGRRQLLWFAVTRHPTAEWLAQQIVEAFPWDKAPTYLVRDNDGAYGQAFLTRVRTMGIRDRPISPRSPWQNPYVERLIGTLRRDCLDHVLIFGERHLRRVLTSYSIYYNETRTHLGLGKDAPLGRAVQQPGTIVTAPVKSPYAVRSGRIQNYDGLCCRDQRQGHRRLPCQQWLGCRTSPARPRLPRRSHGVGDRWPAAMGWSNRHRGPPSAPDEETKWRASRAKAIRQGNIEENDVGWIAFLVALTDGRNGDQSGKRLTVRWRGDAESRFSLCSGRYSVSVRLLKTSSIGGILVISDQRGRESLSFLRRMRS